MTCAVGTLPVGETRVFTFTAQLADPYNGPAALVNNARLDAPGDIDLSNNEDEVTTRVPPPSTPIPTLSQWGLILLSLLMAGFALRRRG